MYLPRRRFHIRCDRGQFQSLPEVEPFLTADLGRLIKSWVPQRTVLLVEHHMELVMDVCELIWVLDAGKVIAGGSPEEVRSDPAVLAAYLGDEGED